jgi:hypothetical protein
MFDCHGHTLNNKKIILRATHRGPDIRLYFCFAHSQNSDKQTIFSPQSAFVTHRSKSTTTKKELFQSKPRNLLTRIN